MRLASAVRLASALRLASAVLGLALDSGYLTLVARLELVGQEAGLLV